MYTVETNRTGDIGSNGQPIWEVIVRDMKGHAVHSDFCYECDLDRMLAELLTIEEPEPGAECTIRMSVGSVTRYFMTLPTLREANEVGNQYDWEFTDENGIVWQLYIDN